MAKKVFIDPVDKKQFTTRKLAKQHMMKEGHKGAIIVEEVETPVVKTTTLPKKGKYKCPECDKTSRTLKGIQDHMKAKGHTGQPVLVEKKKVATVKQEEKVVAESKPAPIIKACMVLRTEDAEKIKNEIPDGMILTQNPYNANIVLEYSNYQYEQLDYLMFKYDFVEVAMTNADLMYGLELITNPEDELSIYDLAQLKSWGIEKMEDGKVIVSVDSSVKLSSMAILDGLKDTNPEKLACVTGLWKKVTTTTSTTVNKPKPVTTPVKETPPKQLPEPKKKEEEVQTYVENFDDWDVSAWVAESYPFSLASESRYMGGGGYYGGYYFGRNYTPPKPPEPPTPKSYAIYGLTQIALAIDRVIPYEKYE